MTRTEWLKLPIETRANWLQNTNFKGFDNYIAVVRRLYVRFSHGNGVVVDIGGKPAPYRILEDMAWMKYVVNGN
jgi:hypothetical protein